VAVGESVVDVPPNLSARLRVLSSFAGNARKNDELDALATALWQPRANERLAAVDPEAASEAPPRSRRLASEVLRSESGRSIERSPTSTGASKPR
jgi:hypothetical protein